MRPRGDSGDRARAGFFGFGALERERKRGAVVQLALDQHRTAHGFYEVLDDGEPQARATHFARAPGVDAIEALEDARQMPFVDTGPVVADADRDAVVRD